MFSKNKLHFLPAFFLFAWSCVNDQAQPAPESPEKKQQVSFLYEDAFSNEEKVKLEEWIGFTSNAAQKVLGRFPFDLYYHFHREDSAATAVVFGHTARTDSINAAHFYVDPTYSLEDLKADWIAPHEISHLAIPKLPKSSLWFFEGFATYMSRQVMIETGIFTAAQVDSINHARISAVTDRFETTAFLPVVADSLIANHYYPSVYWMGASFFDQVDQKLHAAGKGPLTDVLKEFQVCCHVTSMTVDEIIAAFDTISESKIFSDLYTRYTTSPCNQLLEPYKN
jgi:hypothetical protein